MGTPCERPPRPAPATRLVTVSFSPSQCFPPAVSELDLRSRFSLSLGFCGETCAPGSRFYFQHRVLFPAHIRRFDKQQLHTRLGSWDLELEATPEAMPASPLEPWGPARFSGGRRRAAGRRTGPPGDSHPSLPAWGRSSVWASWASGRCPARHAALTLWLSRAWLPVRSALSLTFSLPVGPAAGAPGVPSHLRTVLATSPARYRARERTCRLQPRSGAPRETRKAAVAAPSGVLRTQPLST